MQVQKALKFMAQIEEALEAGVLSEQMAHNAMVNLDRALGSFGRRAGDWRKNLGFENGNQIPYYYSAQDLREFVAHKREMFAKHPYMLDRA